MGSPQKKLPAPGWHVPTDYVVSPRRVPTTPHPYQSLMGGRPNQIRNNRGVPQRGPTHSPYTRIGLCPNRRPAVSRPPSSDRASSSGAWSTAACAAATAPPRLICSPRTWQRRDVIRSAVANAGAGARGCGPPLSSSCCRAIPPLLKAASSRAELRCPLLVDLSLLELRAA